MRFTNQKRVRRNIIMCSAWKTEKKEEKKNETQFLPVSGRIDTAIWMHYLDAN